MADFMSSKCHACGQSLPDAAPSFPSSWHWVMIPLTNGKFAIVDEADAGMILRMGAWSAKANSWGAYYAGRLEGRPQRLVSMHALIAGCEAPDHVNRNSLDNRRINLRPATPEQNNANRARYRNSKSGYKGVYWAKRDRKWKAAICVSGRRVSLGLFDDPVEAARAYNAAALKAWGEYAWLNPIPDATEPPAALGPVLAPGRRTGPESVPEGSRSRPR